MIVGDFFLIMRILMSSENMNLFKLGGKYELNFFILFLKFCLIFEFSLVVDYVVFWI